MCAVSVAVPPIGNVLGLAVSVRFELSQWTPSDSANSEFSGLS